MQELIIERGELLILLSDTFPLVFSLAFKGLLKRGHYGSDGVRYFSGRTLEDEDEHVVVVFKFFLLCLFPFSSLSAIDLLLA